MNMPSITQGYYYLNVFKYIIQLNMQQYYAYSTYLKENNILFLWSIVAYIKATRTIIYLNLA